MMALDSVPVGVPERAKNLKITGRGIIIRAQVVLIGFMMATIIPPYLIMYGHPFTRELITETYIRQLK